MANVDNNKRTQGIKRNNLRQHNNKNTDDNNNDGKGGGVGKSEEKNYRQNKLDPSASSIDKQQKKKPSLVREGLDSNNKPIPKPKPKTKVQPPRRGPNPTNPSYRHGANDDYNSNINNMRDGDVDSLRNNDRLHNDSGSVSLNGMDYSNNDSDHPVKKVPNQRAVPKGNNKGNPKASEVPSVRQRYYDSADMDDVLQDKIVHQLRENGVSETKVAYLSGKIAQAVRDDVMMERKASTPTVISNLSTAISDHLDVVLHNSRNHTDLSHVKPHDASELSQIVLMRVSQVHEELETCKSSLDNALQSARKPVAKDGDRFKATGDGGEEPTSTTTPRDPRDRSMVMAIKDGIDEQNTQREIAVEHLTELQKNKEDVDQLTQKHNQEIQMWDDENLQLKKYLTEADQDNETLVTKVKEQQQENEKLNKMFQASRKEVERLQKQIDDLVAQGHVSGKEMAALQSEKARLQVLCDQRYKEILHLRDPDKDLLHQIRALKEEVTSLRTQTRRLTEEKGMLKAKTQKMEAALDESLKQRNKVTTERDGLFKENQEIRQKFRKLTLATPAQRSLPEIMTPRTRTTSRNTTLLTSTRANSRADSSVPTVKSSWSEDNTNKLPTHVEEISDNPALI